jgi:Protein of unknown function (DUF3892)
MAVTRQVSCISKRHHYFEPHEIIESLGGEYLGSPWRLPEFMVIYYIKQRFEKYYVAVGDKKLQVIIAVYNNKEYLKSEADDYSPATLLTLPVCPKVSFWVGRSNGY